MYDNEPYILESPKAKSYDRGLSSFSENGPEWADRIPLGIFYKSERPSLHDLDPVTKNKIPVKEPLGFKDQGIDVQEVFDDFR